MRALVRIGLHRETLATTPLVQRKLKPDTRGPRREVLRGEEPNSTTVLITKMHDPLANVEIDDGETEAKPVG